MLAIGWLRGEAWEAWADDEEAEPKTEEQANLVPTEKTGTDHEEAEDVIQEVARDFAHTQVFQ